MTNPSNKNLRVAPMLKEKHILYENGPFWVMDDIEHEAYTVFRSGVTHSTSDSSYARTEDGYSLAVARCDYLAKRGAA